MDSNPLSVLVTGSSGFIGRHVVRRLHEAGHRVTALDFCAPPLDQPAGVDFHLCDIRHGILPARRVDALVHLAAIPGASVDDPLRYLETNIRGTLRLLEWCRHTSTPHIIFASSIPDPCSPYALSKLQGEQWGELYANLYGLRFVALRFLNGDGHQRRDPTHAEELVRAIELALHWPGPGSTALTVGTVGTGKNQCVMDTLEAARKSATPPHS